MRKGQNSIMVACTLELINLIRSHAGKESQNEGFWVIKRLLAEDAEFKAKFIEQYGKEKYEATVKHYSITNIEQRHKRQIAQKEHEIREKAKLEIERIRAEAYKKQVENMPTIAEEPQIEPKINEQKRKEIRKQIKQQKRLLKVRKDLDSKEIKESRKKTIKELEQRLAEF